MTDAPDPPEAAGFAEAPAAPAPFDPAAPEAAGEAADVEDTSSLHAAAPSPNASTVAATANPLPTRMVHPSGSADGIRSTRPITPQDVPLSPTSSPRSVSGA
ncbi:hypothetical protein F7Q99_31705 [Streptomyces kaniharaensis]|uniref:Uncharacterized protein n=1 Tax=Streptomyces kaniharaensis TaxID=212423 RepID=A0A6N7KYX6_9ACTN|nr:hypothetical protein [Streptomyces kaniharaensis]MQS16631.1 hypothetical protein [Streptomyces kaniharaensis]